MKKLFKIITLSLTVLFIGIFSLTFQARAADPATPPVGLIDNMKALGNAAEYKTEGVTNTSVFQLVGTLVNIFLQILGVIFVILFIVAGYHWMMAGGDTTKLDKAKDSMWRAIIGLLIIIGAYAIQSYVFTRL